MFRTISDFTTAWQHETAATLKLMAVITDSSLPQRINEPGRELRQLAIHLTDAIPSILNQTDLKINFPAHDAKATSAETIRNDYEQTANAALEAIKNQWTDASLTESISLFGQQWTKGGTLMAMIMHQAHHRGQLTVLMRQAGLRIPGIYGPTREEMAEMGRPVAA